MLSFRTLFFLLVVLIASDATATYSDYCGTSYCYDGYYCLVDKYCCKDNILPETCARNNGINLPSSIKTQDIPTNAVSDIKTAATDIKTAATDIKTAASDIKSLESAASNQVSTMPSLTSAMASDKTSISGVSSTSQAGSFSISVSVSMNVSIPTASATTSANSTAATATKASNGVANARYNVGVVASVFLGLIGFVGYML